MRRAKALNNTSAKGAPPDAGALAAVDWSTLPAPVDDGACDHLAGRAMPEITLSTTSGDAIRLDALAARTVIFIYPMTGTPGVALPDGWDGIPGARGCTPQACSFRDLTADLSAVGAHTVFGLSTQSEDEQAEAARRLHLPFPLISDPSLALGRALNLPTFEAGGRRLYRRVTLLIEAGRIAHRWYPVFPPDRNAGDVVAHLRAHVQPASA